MESKTAEELLQFIGESPSAFHAVDTMKRMLDARQYEQLLEGDTWELSPGGKYYVIRGGTSLIAISDPVCENQESCPRRVSRISDYGEPQ